MIKRLDLESTLKTIDLSDEWVQWYSLHEGLNPRLFASKLTMFIGLIIFIVIILFIVFGGIIGYFSRYNKNKNTLNEEIGLNIEMSKKK